jgi:HrpA-like RNA helicase
MESLVVIPISKV